MLLALVLAGSLGATTTPASDELTVSVQLDVQPKGQAQKRTVRPDETLYEGDRISVRVMVDREAYVYVMQMFPSGDSQTLFPRPATPESERLVPAGMLTAIPRNNGYVQLDQETGEENILVVASSRALDRITPEMIQSWGKTPQAAAAAVELRGTATAPPPPPPAPSRPPATTIQPDERGEIVALADGAVILRAHGKRNVPTIARFRFQHQGSPLKKLSTAK